MYPSLVDYSPSPILPQAYKHMISIRLLPQTRGGGAHMGEKIGRARDRKAPTGGDVMVGSPTSCSRSRKSAS